MKVYEGGIPTDGTELFPKVDMEGEVTETYGGEEGIKTTKGGPATNEFMPPKDFLSTEGYEAEGDIRDDSSLNMKVVNPDDISHSSK